MAVLADWMNLQKNFWDTISETWSKILNFSLFIVLHQAYAQLTLFLVFWLAFWFSGSDWSSSHAVILLLHLHIYIISVIFVSWSTSKVQFYKKFACQSFFGEKFKQISDIKFDINVEAQHVSWGLHYVQGNMKTQH